MAFPMPRDAPVTRAVFPFRSPMCHLLAMKMVPGAGPTTGLSRRLRERKSGRPLVRVVAGALSWVGGTGRLNMIQGAVQNILEAVGRTPIVKLQKVARHVQADIYVKCEYLNPG